MFAVSGPMRFLLLLSLLVGCHLDLEGAPGEWSEYAALEQEEGVPADGAPDPESDAPQEADATDSDVDGAALAEETIEERALRIAGDDRLAPTTRVALLLLWRQVEEKLARVEERAERLAARRLNLADRRASFLAGADPGPPPVVREPKPERPSIPASVVLQAQIEVFSAEAQLRKANVKFSADWGAHERIRRQLRGEEQLYRLGYRSRATVRNRRYDADQALSRVSTDHLRIKELQAMHAISELRLRELSGETADEIPIDLTVEHENMWSARCGQVQERLRSAEIQVKRTSDEVDGLREISTVDGGVYALDYRHQLEAAEISATAARASVAGLEDDLTLCKLTAKQFFLMRQELKAAQDHRREREQELEREEQELEREERTFETSRQNRARQNDPDQ